MALVPIIVFVAAVVALLIASSIPVKMRPIKNLDEFKEMAKRKGLSLEEIDRYVHPLIVRDRNVQITVQVLISVVVLGAALLIILSKEFDVRDKRWAYGSAGTVLGFWLS